MNSKPITIRKIKLEELHLIQNFAPIEWNSNLEHIYKRHYKQHCFYPIVACINDEIAGTGIAIVHQGVAWLGMIIVTENYRNQGLGSLITKHLTEYSTNQGARTILLIASDMGFPVYKKSGFQHDLNYFFYKTDKRIDIELVEKQISPIEIHDYETIFRLDKNVTNENRKEILLDCLKSGYKYSEKEVSGYYLPDFGKGLIIAINQKTGLALLKFKIMYEQSVVCLPETNLRGIEFLYSIGYYEYMKSPRMFLGEKIAWKSECVYARGCGYMG